MKTYLITYTLSKPETYNSYKSLYECIRSYIYWANPLDNIWIIATNQSRTDIWNTLSKHVDINDQVLIMEVNSNWLAYNTDTAATEWMTKSIRD